MLHYLKILRQRVTLVFLSIFYLSGFTVYNEVAHKSHLLVNRTLVAFCMCFRYTEVMFFYLADLVRLGILKLKIHQNFLN